MKVTIEVTEKDVKDYVKLILMERYNINLIGSDIHFEVKSSQNYRAEWEIGGMRARVEKEI